MLPMVNMLLFDALTLQMARVPVHVIQNWIYGPTGLGELRGPSRESSPSEQAHDPQLARRLWEVSVAMTGIDPGLPSRRMKLHLNNDTLIKRREIMKTTTHGDHLIQLTRFSAINCYLVREDDGFTLIDTNIPGSADAILTAVRTYNTPIRRIVLTHDHGDHVGSLDALHEALPNAEVAITAREARFLAGDLSLDADEPQAKLSSMGVPTCKTRPTRLLTQGDRIGSLEVISSPGHSPGHIAFLDLRDHTLIAGDAFQTLGGVAVAGTFKPLFPLVALTTWHKPTALQSAHALLATRPARLATGHGQVLTEPLAEMERAIAVLTQELKKQEQHVSQSRT